jgi:hypothetical protein
MDLKLQNSDELRYYTNLSDVDTVKIDNIVYDKIKNNLYFKGQLKWIWFGTNETTTQLLLNSIVGFYKKN